MLPRGGGGSQYIHITLYIYIHTYIHIYIYIYIYIHIHIEREREREIDIVIQDAVDSGAPSTNDSGSQVGRLSAGANSCVYYICVLWIKRCPKVWSRKPIGALEIWLLLACLLLVSSLSWISLWLVLGLGGRKHVSRWNQTTNNKLITTQ